MPDDRLIQGGFNKVIETERRLLDFFLAIDPGTAHSGQPLDGRGGLQ
ncbi:hypothetical protein [Propionivibrio dicarboxylicus]|nr:hypothetical protein [Propionivibrio dicarboxylicus]